MSNLWRSQITCLTNDRGFTPALCGSPQETSIISLYDFLTPCRQVITKQRFQNITQQLKKTTKKNKYSYCGIISASFRLYLCELFPDLACSSHQDCKLQLLHVPHIWIDLLQDRHLCNSSWPFSLTSYCTLLSCVSLPSFLQVQLFICRYDC